MKTHGKVELAPDTDVPKTDGGDSVEGEEESVDERPDGTLFPPVEQERPHRTVAHHQGEVAHYRELESLVVRIVVVIATAALQHSPSAATALAKASW